MSMFQAQSRHEVEYQSRAGVQNAYCGRNTALCRVLGTYLMYVDTVDRSVSPRMLLDGYWEPWTTVALCKLVEPGMRCINVGANFGYFVLLLADLVGPTGRVNAFEPNPRAFELLRASVEVNGFAHRVTCEQLAVSDRTGRTQLHVADHCVGGGFVGDRERPTSDGAVLHRRELRTVDVEAVRLDDVVGAGQRVDLVIMDVEGSEAEVWSGMQRVRQDNPGIVVIMEYLYTRYAAPMAFLKELSEACGSRGLEAIDDQGQIVPANLAALARGETGVPNATDALVVVRQ
jgi:FkbM family methyltransferase